MSKLLRSVFLFILYFLQTLISEEQSEELWRSLKLYTVLEKSRAHILLKFSRVWNDKG